MAGYGLTDAINKGINAYTSVSRFTQDQADRDYELKQRARQEQINTEQDTLRANQKAADQAAAGVIEKSKAEWALNGAQGQYTPNDTTMFEAAQARGQVLAKAGDWNSFIKNEAMVQPQRVRVRAGALQRYEQDGDIEALARTVYPTVFDGKQITGVEKVQGADAVGNQPAIPNKLKFTLSDGTEQTMAPDQIVKMVKTSLIDPQKAAEQEIMLNLERAKNDIKVGGEIKVEGAKGDQARKTEMVKTEGKKEIVGLEAANAKELEGTKANYALNLAGVNNASAEKRTGMQVSGGLQEAGIRASASRYSADKGLEGTKYSSDNKATGEKDGLAVAKKWTDLAKDHFGKVSGGAFGSSRMSDQATLDLAVAAQRIHSANPGITETQALDQAAKYLKLKSPGIGLDSLDTK